MATSLGHHGLGLGLALGRVAVDDAAGGPPLYRSCQSLDGGKPGNDGRSKPAEVVGFAEADIRPHEGALKQLLGGLLAVKCGAIGEWGVACQATTGRLAVRLRYAEPRRNLVPKPCGVISRS